MTLLLAGDVGGTKTFLRLVEADTSANSFQTLYEAHYPSRNFPHLLPMVQQFFATVNADLGCISLPEKACFGVAGPVINNTSHLTILGWSLNAQTLADSLGIKAVTLINDFSATGYGVLGLQPSDLQTLQVGKLNQDAPIAVIGAGTGLGEGFLIRQNNHYQVFASEGGHTDFPARNDLEFQLLKYLLTKYNIQRVSVERVLSGVGIVAIYQFLRDGGFSPESAAIAQAVRNWENQSTQEQKSVEPAAVIATAALQKSDRLCEQTMQIFVEVYGTEAGNFALKLLPDGGLYIAGGIAAKIAPLMAEGSFLQAFTDKGRLSPLLENIPVHIILNQQVGLIGAAICAAGL